MADQDVGERHHLWRLRGVPGKREERWRDFVDRICCFKVPSTLCLWREADFLYVADVCAIRIAEQACRALKGEKGLRECAFVYLPGIEGGKEVADAVGVDFFSAPIELSVRRVNIDLPSSCGYKKMLT